MRWKEWRQEAQGNNEGMEKEKRRAVAKQKLTERLQVSHMILGAVVSNN